MKAAQHGDRNALLRVEYRHLTNRYACNVVSKTKKQQTHEDRSNGSLTSSRVATAYSMRCGSMNGGAASGTTTMTMISEREMLRCVFVRGEFGGAARNANNERQNRIATFCGVLIRNRRSTF
jgi:hypothetical protein